MIDAIFSNRLYLRISGLTYGNWVVLATEDAEIDTDPFEGLSKDKTFELLNSALDSFNDHINESFREGANGYIQIGNTSINILRFDALKVCYVQGSQELRLKK
jgi:hypothetical protein